MKKKIAALIHFIRIFLNKLQDDHITAYSAMSAYFLLMSFIPFVMLLLMLAKYLPFTKTDVINILGSLSFIEDTRFLQVIIQAAYEQSNSTVLGITVFALLFTASKCMWGFMKGLNSVYGVLESRKGITVRLWAVFYTITFLFLIIFILIFFVFGFSILILTLFFILLYMHIPAHKTSFHSQVTGAVFASLGWSVFSQLFSFYVLHFSNYIKIYGSIGAVLLFLLWLYFLMYILFLGAEINSLFTLYCRTKK